MNDRSYRRQDDPSFLERHRDPVSVIAGAGAGAIAGAMVGGTKGAWIGAAVGAGSAAVYTYVLRDRDQDRYWEGRRSAPRRR